MDEALVKNLLINKLKFNQNKVKILETYQKELIIYNKRYNLISKSDESRIWFRHILDSAQLVKYISFDSNKIMIDLGSGAGFPGIILSIYNDNPEFHVKLIEKSKIKANFLQLIKKKIGLKVQIINENIYNQKINADYLVCRAFKKMPEVVRISREICKKTHKLIVLKGKNAQKDADKAFKTVPFKFKMENSITDDESKIIICNFYKK